MEEDKKLVIVTGSSKGIGFYSCQAFLERGYYVAGISRSGTNLQHENFRSYVADISKKEDVSNTFNSIKSDFKRIPSVLVNNAGLGFSQNLIDISDEQWHKMFDVNVHGLYYCTKATLPDMIKNENGHIINISSIAGNTGIETMAGYCGTKHAVKGISHSLYKEVRNFGIKVTCIYPGSVNTNFFDDIESVTANQNMMRPQDIASSIIQIVETHHNYHVVDLEIRPLKPKG